MIKIKKRKKSGEIKERKPISSYGLNLSMFNNINKVNKFESFLDLTYVELIAEHKIGISSKIKKIKINFFSVEVMHFIKFYSGIRIDNIIIGSNFIELEFFYNTSSKDFDFFHIQLLEGAPLTVGALDPILRIELIDHEHNEH